MRVSHSNSLWISALHTDRSNQQRMSETDITKSMEKTMCEPMGARNKKRERMKNKSEKSDGDS